MLEKLSTDPFLRSQNGASSGSVAFTFVQFVLMVCQVDCYWNILKLRCRTYRAHIAS